MTSREPKAKRPNVGRGEARTKLTDEHKIYIVRRLAAYDSLIVIARGLKQDFGITVTIQLIQNYNPERVSGQNLSQRWRDLFSGARKAYLAGTEDIGAKHPPIRIRWRGEMAMEMWGAGQHAVANDILDSIVKEGDGAPDESPRQGHYGLSGSGLLTATVNIVHRHEPGPGPEPTHREKKPDE
jgi:hypothetical protein